MPDDPMDEDPEVPAPPAVRECGWFDSSLELREGLDVLELCIKLPPTLSPPPEADPGSSTG